MWWFMNKKKTFLSKIAEIRQGYQFREKVVNNPNGLIKVVQMANIFNGKRIDYQNLVKTTGSGFKQEHFLKKGDILFCARGTNNYALLINEDMQNTIAVSQFFIIRTKETELLPGYLVWYLGQSEANAHFKANTLVSTVPLINKKSLLNIRVPLPSLSKQKSIAEIFKLKEKERNLIEQIIQKKEKVINGILLKSIKNMEKI